MNHSKAVISMCIVAFLWSLAGLNIKLINWSPFAITGGRSILVLILLTPVVMHSKHRVITKPVLWGAIFYTLFTYCFIISTKLTVAAIATLMQYTAPVYVALFSYIVLKEKVSKADLLCMVTVFVGMILFFVDDFTGGNILGNIIAVFNGITFAGFSLSCHMQKNTDPVVSVYLGNIFSSLIGIPFVIKAGVPDFNSFIFLLLLALQVTITYTLYNLASRSLTGMESVLLPILDPLLNPIWVYLFLDEKIGTIAILGGIIVLISIVANVMYSMRHPTTNERESISQEKSFQG